MLSSRPFATVNISLGALSALAAFGVAPALTRCYSGLLTLFGRIAVRTADGQDAIADNAAVPAARPGTIIRVVGSDGHTLQEKQQNKLQSCVSQPAVAALCCSRRISTPLAVAGIQQQGAVTALTTLYCYSFISKRHPIKTQSYASSVT